MKERVYYLRIHSISRFLISMMTLLISSLLLLVEILPHSDNQIIFATLFIVAFICSFYLATLLGMGKIKVHLNEKGIAHIWQRKFIFSRGKNFLIPWEMVDNYVFEEDRTFDSFIVNLTNKKRYKISQLNMFPIKDDFKKLIKNFPKMSNELKQRQTSSQEMTLIKEGESFYASKSFRWFFYFMAFGFLILFFAKVINTEFKTTWGTLGVLGSALVFYGLRMKRHRNKNDKSPGT